MAQQTVSGTVTNAQTGGPMVGVNILVVGTSTGTVTDTNGHYSVTVPSLQDSLRFSFIGFQTQTVPINGQTTIDVALKPTIVSGQQLVVVGYGTVKKKNLTGSVVSVSMENKISNDVSTNLMQSLAGSVAGLNVSQTGGAGSSPSFSIRGRTSFSGSGQPLIVIDGAIYYGSLSNINPMM